MGAARLRQSTALVGATLFFCLFGAAADAQIYYYNNGGTNSAPDPQNSPDGEWTTSNSVDIWLQGDGAGNYTGSNTSFDNGDDVGFLTTGGQTIFIELENALAPDRILVERGSFEFEDADDDADFSGELLSVSADGTLFLDVDLAIEEGSLPADSGTVVVEGTLQLRTNRVLTVENGVSVNGDGALIVNGQLAGSVNLNDNGTITFGSGSRVTGTLTMAGTGASANGRVNGLLVTGDASFGGNLAQVDSLISNTGTLALGAGNYFGGMNNSGALNLTADVTFGTPVNARSVTNSATGVISTSGGSRTLTVNGALNNEGTLQSGNATDTLTVEATTINLDSGSILSGNVILAGAITNAVTLDMVHVPVLEGAFTNTATGTATVAAAVDGNGQTFDNAGTLNLTGGSLTDLDTLTNTGDVTVSQLGALEAETITHNAGTLTSRGRLQGDVTLRSTASLQGSIIGTLAVNGGTTTVTAGLNMGASAGGGRVDIGSAGTLNIADGATLTAALVDNAGDLQLATVNSVIRGDVDNAGEIGGLGRITGDLTFSGSSSSVSTGTVLTVEGALINNRDDSAAISEFAGINADLLINNRRLTIDQASTANILNTSTGTLRVRRVLTGRIETDGTTELENSVDGRLLITGGTTAVLTGLGGSPVTVGGATGLDLIIASGGELEVATGDLVATGVIRAEGELDFRSARTITAPRLVISGNSGSVLRGTLIGDFAVTSTGQVTLDGLSVSGTAENSGVIVGGSSSGRIVRLQNGFINRNRAEFGSASAVAQINGEFRNTRGAVATIVGNVGVAGSVTGNVVNDGVLTLTGNIADNLFNTGTATHRGDIGGNAVNEGTLNLAGDVGMEIRNNGAGATVNIIGDSSADRLVSTGRTNITAGNSLDLGDPELTNLSGATLNIEGVLESSGSATGVDVQNRQGGTVLVAASGTLDGSLGNGGRATINGTVTGDVSNNSTGVLNLEGQAEIQGTLENRNVVNVSGSDVVIGGGVTNGADGQLNVSGELTADVTNASGGTLSLNGGTITGAVLNLEGGTITGASGSISGDVVNEGTLALAGTITIDGDFVNDESALITQTQDNSLLSISGTFTHNGIINSGGFGLLRITAGRIVNEGELIGRIALNGDIVNGRLIEYTADTTLNDDLTNVSGAEVRVFATVTGTGSNQIINEGSFEVGRASENLQGELLDIGRIENRNTFTIATGSRVRTDSFVNSAGTLSNDGRLIGEVENRAGATLISTNMIIGDVVNGGRAVLSGQIVGDLLTVDTASDLTLIADDLDVTGSVTNRGDLRVEANTTLSADGLITNTRSGTLLARGTIDGDVRNAGTLLLRNGMTGDLTNVGTALVRGRVDGDVANSGTATLTGRITGTLSNGDDGDLADDTVIVQGGLRVGAVTNGDGILSVGVDDTLVVDEGLRNVDGGRLVIRGETAVGSSMLNSSGALTNVAADGSLDVTTDLVNSQGAQLVIRGDVTVGGTLINREDGVVRMVDGATLTGDLRNQSTAFLAGTIDGDLINEGATLDLTGDLIVTGVVINRMQPVTGGIVQPGSPQAAPGAPTTMTVASGTTLTAGDGVVNGESATLVIDGEVIGDVTNDGILDLNNRLTGNLVNNGAAQLEGVVTGDLIFAEGATIDLTGDMTVGGTFNAFDDFLVGAGENLQTGRYLNRAGNQLSVAGSLTGRIENRGALQGLEGGQIGNLDNYGTFYVDTAFEVDGALQNFGTVDMTTNGTATDVLTVNGDLSGGGTFALDLDFQANGGDGASDRVVVRGGAVTGAITLSFALDEDELTADDSDKNILVFDVDGSQANDFTVTALNLPAASERLIYSVVEDAATGDLYMRNEINPALGALSGNLALTQSLIGSVVNRPSSPYVPGLAGGAGEKPCGVGGWARALAGRASATGRTAGESNSVASSIEASYRGLQFGGDLACFEGSVSGWDVAFGAIGGVNDGSTTQPVYLNATADGTELTDRLGSINYGDFRQLYGGIYATASRDRWFLDLQMRRERTAFTINNEPVADNTGLQLENSDFDSNATTISGAVSYAYALPKEGWVLVPTAGFAFSNLSVDRIYFEDDAELQIEDSKNRVGFVGGTLSKTFVNQQRQSIINAFGTATVYKDFAPETSSVFILRNEDGSVSRQDRLESSNLGTYGEVSFGLNYSKLLNAGSAKSPRQFNASIRVDGRAGDVLDSYGITAQVRLQF